MIIMKIVNKYFGIFLLIFFIGCNKKTEINIYESDEYKSLTKKDIIVGESIFAIACGQCHRFGNNGAIVLENKKYWDISTSYEKGI